MNNAQPEKTTQTTLQNMRPVQEKIENLPAVSAGFNNLQSFELLQRQAKMIASSTIIPDAYQGNIANCAVALEIATRIGCGYMQVMQNLDVIHGRPAWRAKFLISTVNTCGRFSAIRFEFFGAPNTDSWGCRAWAIEKSTNEKLVGPDITIKLAKEEKWYDKAGSKWKSIPQKMLMYRAGAWWSDLYAPELAMGLQTKEEVFDVWDAERQEDGSYAVGIDQLRQPEKQPDNNDEKSKPSKKKASAKDAADPATGEVIEQNQQAAASDTAEPMQPITIPAKAIPGNASQTDWESFSLEWERLVIGMHDEQSLEKLQELNMKVLARMEKINPTKYNWCCEVFANRMADIGAVGQAA